MTPDLFTPTEEQEQTAVFQWADIMQTQYPELALLFHIPNGGVRSKTEAVRFKRAGVKAGVPDLFLPVPRSVYHGLFIELKRRNGSRVRPEQKAWLDALENQRYFCVIARGAEAACQYIQDYLDLK